MVVVDDERSDTAAAPPSPLWRLVRIVVIALALVLLLPYLLVPLYRVVDPVSTLMRVALGDRRAGGAHRWFQSSGSRRSCRRPSIAAEDARFCTHHGVDWQEIREALEEADDLSEARGGSTITQQTRQEPVPLGWAQLRAQGT